MTIDPSKFQYKPTKVYYLKMEQRPEQRIFDKTDVSFDLLPKPISVEDYLKLYKGVGFDWNWFDRLVMPKEELKEKINASNVHIYVVKVNGETAGYAELEIEKEFVELVYFGLMPGFIGKGLGKYFLDWSIQKAWSYHPLWIQVNTCELDHEYALTNYRNLGFKDYKSTVEERKILKG